MIGLLQRPERHVFSGQSLGNDLTRGRGAAREFDETCSGDVGPVPGGEAPHVAVQGDNTVLNLPRFEERSCPGEYRILESRIECDRGIETLDGVGHSSRVEVGFAQGKFLGGVPP